MLVNRLPCPSCTPWWNNLALHFRIACSNPAMVNGQWSTLYAPLGSLRQAFSLISDNFSHSPLALWHMGRESQWDEAATFLRLLAHTKARQTPALLRHSLTNALIHRWSAMLTHAVTHAFAASLLDQDLSGCHNLEGNTPSISEILAEVPTPPATADSHPLLRRPGWTWPSPMHIRGPPVFMATIVPNAWSWPVKQSLLLEILRSKRRGQKKNNGVIHLAENKRSELSSAT